jgi:ribosomal protein L37E
MASIGRLHVAVALGRGRHWPRDEGSLAAAPPANGQGPAAFGRALRAALTSGAAPALSAASGPVAASSQETNVKVQLEQTAGPTSAEPETAAHWWCNRCGRWELCDDRDRCAECAWMSPTTRLWAWFQRRPRR